VVAMVVHARSCGYDAATAVDDTTTTNDDDGGAAFEGGECVASCRV